MDAQMTTPPKRRKYGILNKAGLTFNNKTHVTLAFEMLPGDSYTGDDCIHVQEIIPGEPTIEELQNEIESLKHFLGRKTSDDQVQAYIKYQQEVGVPQELECARKYIETLIAQNKMLVEALEEIDAEWCKHPGIRCEETGSRDWCGECSSWIYPREKNPARDVLDKLAKLKEGEKE